MASHEARAQFKRTRRGRRGRRFFRRSEMPRDDTGQPQGWELPIEGLAGGIPAGFVMKNTSLYPVDEHDASCVRVWENASCVSLRRWRSGFVLVVSLNRRSLRNLLGLSWLIECGSGLMVLTAPGDPDQIGHGDPRPCPRDL
eukprot:4580404-Pyramimonas_sp.AAC.2